MVRLCVVGGCLSSEIQARIDDAAQKYAEGDYGAATILYREVLEASPHNPDALHMLGVLAQQARKPELALSLFEAALAERPTFARVQFNRSVVLRLLGRKAEALQSAQMAADTEPAMAEAWDIIGQLLRDQRDFTGAALSHKKAIELQPTNPHFHGNYAMLLFVQGNTEGAYLAARKAEELDVNYPPMLLANILKARGYPELAAQRFANIRMLRPDFKEAAASEAMARLQIGDLEPGWALWEQRPELDASLKDIPLWRGEKVATLWLYEDQGLGDAIQFLRYIPLLKDYVGQIRLHISSALRRLCSDNFPDIEIIETLPPMAEARYRLSSLPFFFKTRLHTIPAAPYIAASHQDRARLRAALSTLSPPRIGLVWAGNPRFRSDNIRSIPFAHLQPLLASGASHFVSLQKDRPGDQSLVAAYGMLDVGVEMRDFADTAAIIAELDLVISVDTATAHLAGALGKPVFILLPFESDWRWLLGRQDSPWYKSARLFRQKAPDDWTPVIDAVRQEVAKFIGGDRSVLHVTPTNGPCLRQHPDALPLPA